MKLTIKEPQTKVTTLRELTSGTFFYFKDSLDSTENHKLRIFTRDCNDACIFTIFPGGRLRGPRRIEMERDLHREVEVLEIEEIIVRKVLP